MLVEDAFGDKAAEMYEIQALATDPAAQGRGYGSALVQYVIEKVCSRLVLSCAFLILE